MRNCLLEITLIAERHTEIAVGPGFVEIKGKGLPVMSDRLAQRAGITQGDAKAVVDPDMIRIMARARRKWIIAWSN